MNDEKIQLIGARLREERLRIDLSQVAFADACGINRGTLATWEKGEQSPTAVMLSAIAGLGIDVLYVVTGQRAGASEDTLAPAEKDLLSAWRGGSPKGRAALAAVAEVLKPE